MSEAHLKGKITRLEGQLKDMEATKQRLYDEVLRLNRVVEDKEPRQRERELEQQVKELQRELRDAKMRFDGAMEALRAIGHKDTIAAGPVWRTSMPGEYRRV